MLDTDTGPWVSWVPSPSANSQPSPSLSVAENFFFFFWQKEKEIGGNVHTQKEQRGGSLTSSLESHSHQIVVVKIAKQLFCVRSCASLFLEIGQRFLSPNSIWNIKKHYLLANRQYQVVFFFFSLCNFRYPDGETCRWSRIHWFHQLQQQPILLRFILPPLRSRSGRTSGNLWVYYFSFFQFRFKSFIFFLFLFPVCNGALLVTHLVKVCILYGFEFLLFVSHCIFPACICVLHLKFCIQSGAIAVVILKKKFSFRIKGV